MRGTHVDAAPPRPGPGPGDGRTPRRLRVGIADLFSPGQDSSARQMFVAALQRGSARLGETLDVLAFGVDVSRSRRSCGIDWAVLASLDGLIVTGSEPTRDDIASEPVMAVIEWLLDDACAPAASTLFSCQSAHAALYLLHGIRRRRLASKQFGVFAHQRYGTESPLTTALPETIWVPHSRWNRTATEDLLASGVTPLLEIPDGDWHLAAGKDGLRRVFLQGHPEYRPDTLMREYRRDLRRYQSGESPEPPEIPHHYAAERSERLPCLATGTGGAAGRATAPQTTRRVQDFGHPRANWTDNATRFFANWLSAIREAVDRSEPVPRAFPTDD